MKQDHRAAILAIGTELTDGQIIDRNSAWISKKVVRAGLQVIEHRSVPDDRQVISLAIGEMSRRVSHLFITGGLGPTSDDFTREVVATYFGRPLKFHEPSWQRIVERFRARGAEAKPIQRQQCYFPIDADVLENPAGTANAFRLKSVRHGQSSLTVYVLPGPPLEIDAVWKLHIESVIEGVVPAREREELYLFKTLGRGESEIAEVVEKEIKGKNLRVGYRAHLPYVEVKLWFKAGDLERNKVLIESIETQLASSIVTRGEEDLIDGFIDALVKGRKIVVEDGVTRGEFAQRVRDRLSLDAPVSLQILTVWPNTRTDTGTAPETGADLKLSFIEDPNQKGWILRVKNAQEAPRDLAVPETSIYKFGTERGRRYFTEKVFHLLKSE